MADEVVTEVKPKVGATKALPYRYIGDHADTLANGRPLGFGDLVKLTDAEVREPHNEMLIADERLIYAEGEEA